MKRRCVVGMKDIYRVDIVFIFLRTICLECCVVLCKKDKDPEGSLDFTEAWFPQPAWLQEP